MQRMISVFSSYITRKDMNLVLSRMIEDALVSDIFCERFEQAIKDQFQYEHVIAFRSPVYALIDALRILDLPKGSKIAISALAPQWHKNAVEEAGYIAQFLDVEEETLQPSLKALEESNPSAVLFFDALGTLPRTNLREGMHIPIIEDISHTLGCYERARGNSEFAHFSIWSLEADSALATGGGGLLCAKNRRDAQILKTSDNALLGELKMTDYNACLGVSQLKSFPQMIVRRKAIYQILRGQLSRTKNHTITFNDEEIPAYAFPVLAQTSVRDIIEYAKKFGVQAIEAFKSSVVAHEPDADTSYPIAHTIAMSCLLFPMHHKLTNQQVDQIGKIIATLP